MVGFGQSLDYDYINEDLVLTGLSTKINTTGHTILRMSTKLKPCGSFRKVGYFGDAKALPMCHASTLDIPGQRLFTLLVPDNVKGQQEIGIIDLKKGVMTKTVLEANVQGNTNELIGMQWNEATKMLIGVLPGTANCLIHETDVCCSCLVHMQITRAACSFTASTR